MPKRAEEGEERPKARSLVTIKVSGTARQNAKAKEMILAVQKEWVSSALRASSCQLLTLHRPMLLVLHAMEVVMAVVASTTEQPSMRSLATAEQAEILVAVTSAAAAAVLLTGRMLLLLAVLVAKTVGEQ